MYRLLSIILILSAVTAMRADDRPMFVMAGDISRLVTESDNGEMTWLQTVDFDADGLISAIDGIAPAIERDDLGRPVAISLTEEDEDGEAVTVVHRLTYVGDTFNVKHTSIDTGSGEGSWECAYTYDLRTGRAITKTITEYGETDRFGYTYITFDPSGNWTERSELSAGSDYRLTQRRHYTLRPAE